MSRIIYAASFVSAAIIFAALFCINRYGTNEKNKIEEHQEKHARITVMIDIALADEELTEQLLEAFNDELEYRCVCVLDWTQTHRKKEESKEA